MTAHWRTARRAKAGPRPRSRAIAAESRKLCRAGATTSTECSTVYDRISHEVEWNRDRRSATETRNSTSAARTPAGRRSLDTHVITPPETGSALRAQRSRIRSPRHSRSEHPMPARAGLRQAKKISIQWTMRDSHHSTQVPYLARSYVHRLPRVLHGTTQLGQNRPLFRLLH